MRKTAYTIALGSFVAAIAASIASSAPAPGPVQSVDLELVLATDNSQSIDLSEARLQRQGVAAAIRHPDVVKAIASGSLGRIAVAYIDWSSGPYTRLAVDWRVISDKASADAFAEALLRAPPGYGSGTAIGETLGLAAFLIESNNFQGTQRTIDISGDGPNNSGRAVHMVRDEVIAKGITINGLPIVNTGDYGNGDWGIYYGELENYYVNCIIGGPRSFALPARGFQEFAAAIRHKLVLEISDAGPAQPPIVKVAASTPAPQPLTPLRPAPGMGKGGGSDECGSAGRIRRFRF